MSCSFPLLLSVSDGVYPIGKSILLILFEIEGSSLDRSKWICGSTRKIQGFLDFALCASLGMTTSVDRSASDPHQTSRVFWAKFEERW
jgi:hypothetical protein